MKILRFALSENFCKPARTYTYGTRILAVIIFFFSSVCSYAQWVPGYSFKSKVTIQGSQVCGSINHDNFPILLRLTDNFLKQSPAGLVNHANGYDIIFTASDQTTILDHEIDYYDNVSGTFAAWIKIPALAPSVDTEIYMYYGNPAVTTSPSLLATWNNNYRTVYHFENDNFNDATANSLNGTNLGTTKVTAKIGEGRSFDGVSQYIQSTSNDLATEDSFTISAWFKTNATTPAHILWQGLSSQNGWGSGGGGAQELNLSLGTCCPGGTAVGGNVSAFLGDREEQSSTDVLSAETPYTNTTSWQHLVATVSNLATAPVAELFLNGVSVSTNAGVTGAMTARNLWDTPLRIGRPGVATRFFNGQIDEVRISNSVRSADWICTEYNNQNSPATFVSLTLHPPVLAALEAATINFSEGDPATLLTGAITTTDWDDLDLVSATIAITGNYNSTEDELAFTNANGIIGTWDAGTGILSLSGSSTVANYEAALRSITYRNTNGVNPSTLTRTISFTVNDGTANSNSLTRDITLTAINDAPVISNMEIPTLTFTEDQPAIIITATTVVTDDNHANLTGAIIQITTNYVGSQDRLYFTDAAGITGAFNTTTGILTLSGSSSAANYQDAIRTVRYQNIDFTTPSTALRTVSIRLIDGALNSNTVTRNIAIATVNDSPNAVNDFYSTSADSPLTANARSNDWDPENNTLTFTVAPVVAPAYGTVIISSNGNFTYTPNGTFTGTVNFTYQVCDNGNDNGTPASRCSQAVVQIIINPSNPFYNIVGNNSIEISTHCFILTKALDTQQGAIWNRMPLDLRYSFELNFDAILSDSGVTNDDGADGIMFALQRDNTPPPLNVSGSPIDASGLTGEQLGIGNVSPSIGIELDTYQNAGEPAYDHIAISKNGSVYDILSPAVPAAVDGLNNPLNIEDGVAHSVRITWDKPTNTLRVFFDGVERTNFSQDIINTIFNGDPTNVYWGFAASTGGKNNYQGVCGIDMKKINLAPLPGNDGVSVNEDNVLNSVCLSNDTDPEQGTLSAMIENKTTANGSVSIKADGTFTYTPTGNFRGIDSFTYQVCDNFSASECSTGTVTIDVVPVNDTPVATADAYDIDEDILLTVSASGILSNDIDVDGDVLTAVLESTTQNGTLTFSTDGSFTYLPNADFSGADSFTYTARDASTASTITTVNINVQPVNDAPLAVDDGPILHESVKPFTIDVLLNDSDIDNDFTDLSIVSATVPTFGSVKIEDGKIIYTPAGTESGFVTFSYTIRDTDGLTDEATVTIEYTYMPLKVSEGFSPNGDGNNETWYMRSIESFPDNAVKVFDRWGTIVYQARNYDNATIAWNGQANSGMQSGKIVEQGTYYYVIDLGNSTKALSGFVMILK